MSGENLERKNVRKGNDSNRKTIWKRFSYEIR